MMSARSMASATVSFGLVSIPVKLYPSADSSACIGLNRLHKTCGGRMKQQYYCPTDDGGANSYRRVPAGSVEGRDPRAAARDDRAED